MAWRRSDGAARPRFFTGAAIEAERLVQVLERSQQLGRELAGVERLRPARQPHREVGRDLDAQLTAVELDRELARRARQMRRHGRARGARSRRQGLPHAPLEDAGGDAVAAHAKEAHVRAVWEQLVILDLVTDCAEVERLEL